MFEKYFRYDAETGKLYWKKMPCWRIHVGDEIVTRNEDGSVCISFFGKCYRAHRVIAAMFLGLDIDDKLVQVIHINGIKDDNRLENLRLVRRIGCYFDKRCQKWQAQIHTNGKTKYLGRFATEQEAHEAYLKAVSCLKTINQ